jgi:hypothetical protein
MTIQDDILRQHESSMKETLEKLLTGVAQGGDIKNDANITKMMELNASIIRKYVECSREALFQLEQRHPHIIKQVSVNEVKRHRVEKSNRAIIEREEKRIELMRKLKSLRKNAPDAMRNMMNASN